MSTVPCLYPDPIDDDGYRKTYLPDGFDEWKAGEFCTHDYCIEAASYARQWRAERESVALARIDIDSDETGDLTREERRQIQTRLK